MTHPRHPHTLLIVDDEPNFSESLQMALDDVFTVAATPSLRGAVEHLRREVPDVILLDIRLPDGDGIELLRTMEHSPQLPIVVVMTAHATVENAVRAL